MRKIIWIPLALAATVAVVVAALPLAIEHLAERWLRDQAVESAAIENVDFNPFTGLLRIESVVFSGRAGERGELDSVELDLAWGALFSGRLELSRFEVSGGRIDILKLDDGRYRIGGLTIPPAGSEATEAEPEDPWGMGLTDLSLDDIELAYRDPLLDSRLLVRRLSLDRIATWEPERATQMSASFDLDGAPVVLEVESTPLALEPEAEIGLKLERFSLGSYPAVFEALKLPRAEGRVSFDLSSVSRYRGDGTLLVEVSGEAALADAHLELPPVIASGTRLEWSGKLSVTVSPEPTTGVGLSGDGAVSVLGFALRQIAPPTKLAGFERLDLTDLIVHGLDRFEIGRVELAALELLGDADGERAVGSIGEISLVDSEFQAGTSLNIDSATLADLILDLERTADGDIALVSEVIGDYAPDAMTSEGPDAAPAESEAEPSIDPLVFRLATLEIGGASRVRFRDNAVTPPLSTEFSIQRLRLSGIDSGRPEQSMRVQFDFVQADGATVTGEGDLLLFGDQLASDFEVALDRLNLTQLSSYLPAYHIQRGRLDLDTTARIRGDTLDVANSVVIEKLKLAGKTGEEQSLLGEGMAMPLDVALDLLRDGDDKIKLELPISGSLSDPQFGTGDIVRTAMQKALQNAALAYAKNALQPLGTILLIGKLAGKAARPRFEPLSFAPGATALTPEASAYLDKIGQLLSERQGLSITFCGVSTPADRDYLISVSQPPEVPAAESGAETASAETTSETPAARSESPAAENETGEAAVDTESPEQAAETPPPSFDAERLELAQQRGAAMQDDLVTRLGIDAERLFRCRPTLDEDPESLPRVEITL